MLEERRNTRAHIGVETSLEMAAKGPKGVAHQWVRYDEGHPADEEKGAQHNGGDVLEHGVHGGLGLGRRMRELLLHIMRHGGGCRLRSLVNQVDDLVGYGGTVLPYDGIKAL